ncbi:hypothetical protein [Scytonema sp. NUACC21]
MLTKPSTNLSVNKSQLYLGVWRNGRRYGLRKLSLGGEIYQVTALKLRET